MKNDDVYVAIDPDCGCTVAVQKTKHTSPDDNADFLGNCARRGDTIHRVTHAEYLANHHMTKPCSNGSKHAGSAFVVPETTREDGLRLFRVIVPLAWIVAARSHDEAGPDTESPLDKDLCVHYDAPTMGEIVNAYVKTEVAK